MRRCVSCHQRSCRWNRHWSSSRTTSSSKLHPKQPGCENECWPRTCDHKKVQKTDSQKRHKKFTKRMRSSFRLPRVYPLTDVQMSGLSHAEQVRLLSDGGASLTQLREKQLSPLEFYEQAKAAMKLAARSRVQLIVNDRVDIALAVGADGVH